MACRAGITTDLVSRKKHWESVYPSLSNWRTRGPFVSRAQAQGWEDRQLGCDRSGGGDDPNDLSKDWYGYSFSF